MKEKYVVCQLWEESERGWGVRPDGYSLQACLHHTKSRAVQISTAIPRLCAVVVAQDDCPPPGLCQRLFDACRRERQIAQTNARGVRKGIGDGGYGRSL